MKAKEYTEPIGIHELMKMMLMIMVIKGKRVEDSLDQQQQQ